MSEHFSEDLEKLIEGNASFVAVEGEYVGRHVEGQSPKAAVLTCADSRVIPEKIFDRGIGELFVIRVAGNVAYEASVIQSLEYAVEHLKVPLLMILGHTNCGAVKAAEESAGPEGILREIAESFAQGDDHVRENVRRQMSLLPERSKAIGLAVDSGQLEIHGAIYNLENGRVEVI
ncbi:MAG: hypothetical protein AYK23_02030 [Candidatus Proteinoplasmatales archaeon SG8-5]|nr:MAG: hypothetical protein AYK23_02030 [Candidatus Proteinoplasmatales archaeon SG8-5]